MDRDNSLNASISQADNNKKIFSSRIHRIGLVSMALALVFSILPTLYFTCIKGIDIPVTAFISVSAALVPFGIGMWITEPMSHWPIFGSAGTYMSVLSGNTTSMRLPVVLAARSSLEKGDDLQDPKVNVAIIIALFASIITNLAVFLMIVLAGDKLMAVFPQNILGAFQYIVPCLIANNILLFSKDQKGDFKSGVLKTFPYLLVGVISAFLAVRVVTILSDYSSLIAVGAAIALSYILFRRDCAADAAKGKE